MKRDWVLAKQADRWLNKTKNHHLSPDSHQKPAKETTETAPIKYRRVEKLVWATTNVPKSGARVCAPEWAML